MQSASNVFLLLSCLFYGMWKYFKNIYYIFPCKNGTTNSDFNTDDILGCNDLFVYDCQDRCVEGS